MVDPHKHMYNYDNKVIRVETDTHIFSIYGCIGCELFLIHEYIKGENIGLNGSTHYFRELQRILNKEKNNDKT